MSYIDDLNQAASEALAASSSATDSAQIMSDVANGDENTTVTTANGEVKTLAKAIKDIIDAIEAGVEAPQVEPQTLSAGQTTVTLSTMTTEGIAVYVEGSREFDFTIVNSTDFNFSQSFPDGTRIWIVKRDIEGVADSFTVNTSTGSQTLSNALDNRVVYVNTIADLQALDTSTLVDGQVVKITSTGRVGDFVVQTGDFSSEVTGDPQSGIWVAFNSNPDGSILVAKRQLAGEFVTPYMFGAVGDGVADDIIALEACRDFPANCYFGDGEFLISRTLRIYGPGKRFVGAGLRQNGKGTVIIGSGVTGPIVTTLKDGDTGFANSTNMEIGNFSVSGSGETGVAFVQNTLPYVHDINLSGNFSGTYGFTFEGTYGGSYSRLKTNGVSVSRACFGIFRVCLNTRFELLYSSNASDYSFEIDAAKTLYSLTSSVGWRENTLENCTAQGANKYGFYVKRADRKLVVNNFYAENVTSTLYIGYALEMSVNSGTLYANNTADHGLWIGGTTGVDDLATGISFNNVSSRSPIIFGNCRQVSFNDCKPEFSNTASSFVNYFERHEALTSNNEIRAILGKSEFRSVEGSSYSMGKLTFTFTGIDYDGAFLAIPLTSQSPF